MTDVAVSVPLHFTLEMLGLALYGALAGWALQRRAWILAGGAGVLFASQVIHTGQFAAGEHDPLVLGLRVAGLAAIVLSMRAEPRATSERPAPQAAAASGAGGLAWLSAGAAAIVAFGHAGMTDRALWAVAWTAVAAGELWSAATGQGPLLLGEDFGAHVFRAAGWGLLGVWTWRRTITSLRARVVAAFALVLFVVVVVAGGAALRVGAANARDDELGGLAASAASQRALFVSQDRQMRDASAVVSRTFTAARGEDADPAQVATELHRQVYADLLFVALFGPDGSMQAASGLDPAIVDVVRGTPGVQAALTGGPVPPVTLEPLEGRLLAVAAAPVFPPGSRERADGAAVLGRELATSELQGMVSQGPGERAAVVVPGRSAVAASDPSFAGATLPPTAREDVRSGRIWTGEVTVGGERWFASAAPLTSSASEAATGGAGPPTLVLAAGDAAVAGAALDVTQALLVAILAAALVAVLIALWLSSRITRPVIDLTATARRVESGDLAASPDVGTPDEIGTLAGAFGSMTGALRSTIASERDTRQRLETIVEGMGEALIAMDADYDIVSFNPAAEEIIGIDASEAIGRKCYDVYGDLTSGRGGQRICDYICPIRYEGGTDPGVTLQRPDGRTAGVAVTCSTLRDEEGRIVGGVDLLRDVTGELEAERMKSNFLANISHELRTPLTPIRGYADILRRKQVSKRQAAGYLDEIVRSAQRLERVVSMLVDVAAMEAGRLEVQPRQVSAREVVRDAAAHWRDRAPGHEIEVVAPANLPSVEADPGLVSKALYELVDNAVKFSPDGGKITIRAKKAPGGVELSVRDRGIGIAPQDVDGLLEEFAQADPTETRRFGGLGLGLAFVQRVVSAHDSHLDITSARGRGSTFSFVLPAASAPARRRGRANLQSRGRKRSSAS